MAASVASDSETNPWKLASSQIIETTRNSHSTCRTCEKSIDAGHLRVGIIFSHVNGFICIDWHHLDCYTPPPHLLSMEIEGYADLSEEDKQKVLKRRMSWEADIKVCVSVPRRKVSHVVAC